MIAEGNTTFFFRLLYLLGTHFSRDDDPSLFYRSLFYVFSLYSFSSLPLAMPRPRVVIVAPSLSPSLSLSWRGGRANGCYTKLNQNASAEPTTKKQDTKKQIDRIRHDALCNCIHEHDEA